MVYLFPIHCPTTKSSQHSLTFLLRPSYYPANATLIRLAFDPTNASSTNLALPEMYDAGCGTVLAVTGNGSSTTGPPAVPSPTGEASSGTVLSSPRNWIILACAALVWMLRL
jgi:hypothetical protein